VFYTFFYITRYINNHYEKDVEVYIGKMRM